MEDFSYTADIAPMRGEFFGRRNTAQLQAGYNTKIAPAQDRIASMRNNLVSLQRSQLDFDRMQLAFQEKRDDMRKEREAGDFLPMIEARANELLADETTTPQQKLAGLADFTSKNFSQISSNSMLAGAVALANDRIKLHSPTVENKALNAQMASAVLAVTNDVALAKRVSAGEVADDEISSIFAGVDAAKLAAAEAAQLQDASDKQSAQRGKATLDQLDATAKFVQEVEVVEFGKDSESGVTFGVTTQVMDRVLYEMLGLSGDLSPENMKALRAEHTKNPRGALNKLQRMVDEKKQELTGVKPKSASGSLIGVATNTG